MKRRWIKSIVFAFILSIQFLVHAKPDIQGGNFPPETGTATKQKGTSQTESGSDVSSEPGFVELANPKKIPEPAINVQLAPSKLISASDGYTYVPTGKRDPFIPYLGTKVMDRVRPETNFETLEPLQKYELNKLEVLAILWDVSHPRAMIKDPSGEIHLVTRGQKIGPNDGYIVAIREGELVVMESFEDGAKTVKEPKIMSLKK